MRPRGQYAAKPSSIAKSEEVINTFYKITEKANAYFENLKNEFDDDTERIQAYASPETLDDLWSDFFRMERGPKVDEVKTCKESKNTSRIIVAELCEGLHSGFLVTRSRRHFTLAEKLQNTEKAVVKSFGFLLKSVEALRSLLTELKMLSVLLEGNGARKGHHGANDSAKKTRHKSGVKDKSGHKSGNRNQSSGHRRSHRGEDRDGERSGDDEDNQSDHGEAEERRENGSDGGQSQDEDQGSVHQEESERDE